MMKRLMAMLLAAVLLAMCAAPALAAAPKVKEVECKGSVVDVEFTSKKVTWKGAKVVVKDAAGKALTVKILEKDNDDIEFKVTGLKANSKYTYTISGVRAGKSGSYGKVTGSFKTPSATKPTIKKVKYDKGDKELEVEFATKVKFKGLKVTVKDANGKALTVKRIEKGDDDVEMKVSGMKKGKTYTVTVSGVSVRGKSNYKKVSKKFVA